MKEENLAKKLINDFRTNKYTYKTNQSVKGLRDKINFVINQKEVFDFRYNLTGNLYSDDTFKLVRRAGFILINNGTGGPPVSIDGELIERDYSKTNIEISIRPNFILVLLPIVFGIISIGSIANSIITQNKESLAGGFALIAIPAFWAMIKSSKRYYKSEFEKALDLNYSDIEIE